MSRLSWWFRVLPTPRVCALSCALGLLGAPVGAQLTGPSTIPTAFRPTTIAVTAESSVSVTPDRGRLTFAVETRAATAQAAVRSNATTQQAVIRAVLAGGIRRAQITTLDVDVSPEYRTLPNAAPQIAGYRAVNSVHVELGHLDRAGALIDTAVGAGATRVAGFETWSSQMATARRQALTAAVAAARADAVAAAAGADLVVDGLVEMTVQSAGTAPLAYGRMESRLAMVADIAPTPIETGTRQVRAVVATTWRLRERRPVDPPRLP